MQEHLLGCFQQSGTGSLGQGQCQGLWGGIVGQQQAPYTCLGTPPEAIPDEDGWYTWTEKRPPEGKLIQVDNDNWDDWEGPRLVVVAGPADSAYQYQQFMNVSGLKWRLTGVAKETE